MISGLCSQPLDGDYDADDDDDVDDDDDGDGDGDEEKDDGTDSVIVDTQILHDRSIS